MVSYFLLSRLFPEKGQGRPDSVSLDLPLLDEGIGFSAFSVAFRSRRQAPLVTGHPAVFIGITIRTRSFPPPNLS